MEKEVLERIEQKIDKIDNHLSNIDVTLAKQSVILEDHTRRSLANEQNIEMLRKDDVAPMVVKWAKVEGAMKLIGIVCMIIGGLVGIAELISYLSSLF